MALTGRTKISLLLAISTQSITEFMFRLEKEINTVSNSYFII